MTSDYNGWSNRATWNVALWLNNDRSLYYKMKHFLCACKEKEIEPTYSLFVLFADLEFEKTGDGYSFVDSSLSRAELTEMLKEAMIEEFGNEEECND